MVVMEPVFQLIDLQTGLPVAADCVIWSTPDSGREIVRDETGCLVKIKPAPASIVDRFIQNVAEVLKKFANVYYGYSLEVPESGVGETTVSGICSNILELLNLNSRGIPVSAIFLRPDILRAALTCDLEALSELLLNCYDELDKDVLRGWGLFEPLGTRVILEFSQQWNNEVRQFVEQVFMEAVSPYVKKLSRKRIYRVVLYPSGGKYSKYGVMDGVAFAVPDRFVMSEVLTDEIKEEWRAFIYNELIGKLK